MGNFRNRVVGLAWAFMLFCCCFSDAYAQPRPVGYKEAEAAYRQLPQADRIYIQILMISAGYWNAVPNNDFNGRIFEAINRYKNTIGREENGVLDQETIQTLEREALPILTKWGFRKLRHPNKPISIWVPFGLGLDLEREQSGLVYTSKSKDMFLSFKSFDPINLSDAFSLKINSMKQKGDNIHFSTERPSFFVIASSTSEGLDRYERYQKERDGILGFTFVWRNSATHLEAARLATIMSASLWAEYNKVVLPNPNNLGKPRFQTAVAASPTITPPVATQPTTQTPKSPQGGSGTGFYISSTGYILTNAHVVEGCSNVEVSTAAQSNRIGKVEARDAINDIALIKTDAADGEVATVRSGVKLGEQVAAFGFPFVGLLSTSGNFTLGNVTSLAGLANDSRYLQISTPIQPGNSGGPLLDQHGNVVGIVTSTLNALRRIVATGDVPQNVNFALKVGTATNFLETHSVSTRAGSTERVLSPTDLAERARRLSVQIRCKP